MCFLLFDKFDLGIGKHFREICSLLLFCYQLMKGPVLLSDKERNRISLCEKETLTLRYRLDPGLYLVKIFIFILVYFRVLFSSGNMRKICNL